MTMRLIPRAAAVSEFIAGFNGDCGETAEMALLHVIDPAAYPLNAADLSTIVKRDISKGWASSNGSEPISAIANDLTTLQLKFTNYGYSEPATFDWRGVLATWGGIKPIVFEYAHAGALPGDESGVAYHFNCCLGWDPATNSGLFADGDNLVERRGGTALVTYSETDLANAHLCGMLVGEYQLGGVATVANTPGSPTPFYGLNYTADAQVWHCPSTSHDLGHGFLTLYQGLKGPQGQVATQILGLPKSNEYADGALTKQDFERARLVYDSTKSDPWMITFDVVYGDLEAGVAAAAQVSSLQSQLASAQANLTAAQQQRDALSAQLAAAQTSLQSAQAQIAQLQQQLAAAQQPAPAPAPAPTPAPAPVSNPAPTTPAAAAALLVELTYAEALATLKAASSAPTAGQ